MKHCTRTASAALVVLITAAMTAYQSAHAAPVTVKLEKKGADYELTRNGQLYFIKGAGGKDHWDDLVKAGGNSVRTWGSDNLEAQLDQAQKMGLTVAVGFWVGHERHGFNYNNAQAVADQLERAKRDIRRYKDHPAVLLWGIGNEMEGDGKNPAVWKAVNDIAKAAKEIDPHHPVMTVVAEVWKGKIENFNRYCPDVDILGINTYGGVQSIRKRYVEAGGTKPYIVTEFGPPGTWEVPKNDWGVANEMNSTAKAKWYLNAQHDGIEAQKDLCLGSYCFIWGFKQEATATWFGMYLKDGSRLGAVESMTTAWGGKPPANRCPIVTDIKLDRNQGLKSGDVMHASWTASDPDGDSLKVDWILRRDSGLNDTGGEDQPDLPEFADTVVKADTQSADIRIPAGGGKYRLFAYAHDGKGNAAVANVPLLVDGKEVPAALVPVKVPFAVYTDAGAHQPFIPSGYMGNTAAIAMDPACKTQPFAGDTCLEVTYKAADGWGGVVWQSPPNDWGNLPGGYNLKNANALTFHARGATGNEVVSFGVGVIGPDKPYPDTARENLKDVALSTEWKLYTLPLSGKDLSRIKSGFSWTTGGKGAPVTFYLDDIQYVFDPNAKPAATETTKTAAAPATATEPAPSPAAAAAKAALPCVVYGDGAPDSAYVPSGYMGNHDAIQADAKCTDNPHSGATCMKWTYAASGNWAGVMWQSPANDWGKQPGGHDLTGATDLEFWARGAEGGEVVSFFCGGLDSKAAYPDSDKAELKDIKLTPAWKKYRIPLDGRNLSCIKTGFAWTLGGKDKPITFYLDDIRYISNP